MYSSMLLFQLCTSIIYQRHFYMLIIEIGKKSTKIMKF